MNLNEQTGKMPWDNIWDFKYYKKSGVTKRTIKLYERPDKCKNCPLEINK